VTHTGPPPESDEGALRVETLAVGPFQTNCHLVHDPASGEGFVVDPGAEAERILGRVAALALRPAYVLLTHGHGDHIAALETVAGALRCPVYIHPADEPMLESPTENLSAFAGTPVVAPVPHRTYADGDELPFAGRTIRVLHTPGHSAGGVSLFVAPDLLFSGDALFRRSIGRTDFPGGSYEALRASIEAKILTLDDQVRVFPGHDRPTTVGEERRENPFLRPG
jgi:glyoxylase-like metal-dependent hydrolase (beta-lactamase superfamily II)